MNVRKEKVLRRRNEAMLGRGEGRNEQALSGDGGRGKRSKGTSVRKVGEGERPLIDNMSIAEVTHFAICFLYPLFSS